MLKQIMFKTLSLMTDLNIQMNNLPQAKQSVQDLISI